MPNDKESQGARTQPERGRAGAGCERTCVKPRVAFTDLAWMTAFEKVKQLGEGATVGDYKVVWIYDDPPIAWLQVKIGKTKKMIRKGDARIFDLVGAR